MVHYKIDWVPTPKDEIFYAVITPVYLTVPLFGVRVYFCKLHLPSLWLCFLNRMSETEQPFRPHEKLVEKQRYFQNIHKHTYLKGPMDKITSVAIPLALAGSALFLIVSFFLTMFYMKNTFPLTAMILNMLCFFFPRDEESTTCHTGLGRKNEAVAHVNGNGQPS